MNETEEKAQGNDLVTFAFFVGVLVIVLVIGLFVMNDAKSEFNAQPHFDVQSVEFIPKQNNNVLNDNAPNIRVVTSDGDFLLQQYEVDFRLSENDRGYEIMQHTGERGLWNNGDGTFTQMAPYTIYITPDEEASIRNGYKERFGQNIPILNDRKKD